MQSVGLGDLCKDGESALWARRYNLRAGPRAGTVDTPSFLAPKVRRLGYGQDLGAHDPDPDPDPYTVERLSHEIRSKCQLNGPPAYKSGACTPQHLVVHRNELLQNCRPCTINCASALPPFLIKLIKAKQSASGSDKALGSLW